ncbi:glycogenin-1 [Trichonephila clavipes]|nr:glycogenin-1 [Trichonephila clavipes]
MEAFPYPPPGDAPSRAYKLPRGFGGDVKIVHFLGNQKPWMFHYNKDTGSIDTPHTSAPLIDYLKMWWKIFNEHVSSKENGPSIAEQLEKMTVSSRQASICSPTNFSEFLVQDRLSEWEQGRIDYLGQDSYDNIEKKLDEAILGPKK